MQNCHLSQSPSVCEQFFTSKPPYSPKSLLDCLNNSSVQTVLESLTNNNYNHSMFINVLDVLSCKLYKFLAVQSDNVTDSLVGNTSFNPSLSSRMSG